MARSVPTNNDACGGRTIDLFKSMQLPIEVHIETAPNATGIDQACLAVTEAVHQRLLQLCIAMQTHGLLSVKVEDVPLRWYQAGVEQTAASHDSTCELVGKAAYQDLTLHVQAWFPVAVDAQGVFSISSDARREWCEVRGEWFIGTLGELDKDRLCDVADESGVILATYDYGENSPIFIKTNNWPNPFTRWTDTTARTVAAHLSPSDVYVKTSRNAPADVVFNKLLQVATDLELNPNSRCVLYILAAALYLCPDEVRLTRDVSDIPPFLRPPGSRDASEVLLTSADLPEIKRMCGTCGAEFSPPQMTLCIRYTHLVGRLVLGGGSDAECWRASHGMESLAIWYEDHANNQFAWQSLREFLPQYPDDHSRMKLLAFGVDALLRRLSPDNPWWEDLRCLLKDKTSYFGKKVEI